MLHSSYYLNYRGPPLRSCVLDNEDITSKMMHAYGETHNWQGSLWTYEELFGRDCQGKHYKFEFEDDYGTQWFYGYIQDSKQYMNPPKSVRHSF